MNVLSTPMLVQPCSKIAEHSALPQVTDTCFIHLQGSRQQLKCKVNTGTLQSNATGLVPLYLCGAGAVWPSAKGKLQTAVSPLIERAAAS